MHNEVSGDDHVTLALSLSTIIYEGRSPKKTHKYVGHVGYSQNVFLTDPLSWCHTVRTSIP